MIVKEEFLAKLRRYFSLNLYEVKIWTALLSRGVATAGELSDIANVPRSRSYDVLESLEKKGFVIMKLGKPIKYIAVQPSEVLDRVKKNMTEEAEEKVKRLEDLKTTDVLTELNLLHSQGIELIEPSELSGSLRGRHNLYNHLELTIRNAEKSVTIMTTSQGFLRKVEGLKPVFMNSDLGKLLDMGNAAELKNGMMSYLKGFRSDLNQSIRRIFREEYAIDKYWNGLKQLLEKQALLT